MQSIAGIDRKQHNTNALIRETMQTYCTRPESAGPTDDQSPVGPDTLPEKAVDNDANTDGPLQSSYTAPVTRSKAGTRLV